MHGAKILALGTQCLPGGLAKGQDPGSRGREDLSSLSPAIPWFMAS